MEILKFPHPSLFTICKEVSVFGEELNILLESMFELMTKSNGIGLAANQVGLHYRMFTMQGPEDEKLFFINPRIISRSSGAANIREGCLSAPGEFVVLPERSTSVEVEFQNEKGEYQKRIFSGIFAVCVQHEIDHLDGKSHLQSKSLSRQIRRKLAKKWHMK